MKCVAVKSAGWSRRRDQLTNPGLHIHILVQAAPSVGGETVAHRSAILSPSNRHMTNPWNCILLPEPGSVQRQMLRQTTLSASAIISSIVR